MKKVEKPHIVVVLGSANDAVRCQAWDKSFHQIVAINNAWRIREDWDCLIYPEDFPAEKIPHQIQTGQQLVVATDFVPAQNQFGGVVYTGGSMAFTAGYWALSVLKPDIMAFLGCDMVYPMDGGKTHFYGHGSPDPLRDDATLQSLEAKSHRLLVTAAKNQCLCVNLSDQPTSRLTFPRVSHDQLKKISREKFHENLVALCGHFDVPMIQTAMQAELDFGYFVESGRYWEHLDKLPRADLTKIDALWLRTLATLAQTTKQSCF